MEQQYNFTEEEWRSCIKVLMALKDNPLDNPDNETFKTLISKIHKQAKKIIRKESYELKKQGDMDKLLQSEISRQAVYNSSLYSEEFYEPKMKYQPLQMPDNCYVCNESFDKVHFFYSRLCPVCAEFNYSQRFLKPDLKHRNVILTGGRVKIGYATALKLLRSGANLILTSRFPALALEALASELDYENWKDRLCVYGLDLRNLQTVEQFIQFVQSRFDYLDILVNNAAQTIRYPDEYYAPLIKKELNCCENNRVLFPNQTPVAQDLKMIAWDNMPASFEKNRFGQPIDNRIKNSWNSRLDEISAIELLEVNLINQISPYLLIKGLKPLFLKSSFNEKFIINVTSSEGQFSYNNKTIYHPHTNMTKAAFNMLTRTSAAEFADDGIYMNSVDVGWVSTGANEELRKNQFARAYIPPLDPVDGAARIIHPVLEIMNGNIIMGKLLKNYHVVNW